MNISPFKIIAISIVLGIIGLFLLPRLSVQLNPSQTVASISVSYNWPNASPYNVEREITSNLEAGFGTLTGLKKLSSRSSKGNGQIELIFNKHISLEMARFEVATIIRQLYKDLPDRASYPIISLNQPDEEDEKAFLSYSITAQETPFVIQETTSNELVPVLASLRGVDKVQVFGANPLEWVVSYDINTLRNLGLSQEDLFNALQIFFLDQSLGEVYYNNQLLSIRLLHKAEGINWNIPVKKIGRRIVMLNEVASIEQKEQESQQYYRVNGNNSITLAVFAKKGVNNIVLARKFNDELKSLKNQLPEGYSIVETYNASDYVQEELTKIYKRSMYTVFILMLFVLLVSRSINYLVVVLLSIIVNLSIAFLFYYFFQIEIQLFSLAGITISLGLIIDNAIVMIDHIRNQGDIKVFVPILASTLTSMGALSIIYFLDDIYKTNLIDFALVIIINLFVSLMVALFFIPAILHKIPLRKKKKNKLLKSAYSRFYKMYAIFIHFTVKHKRFFTLIILLTFGIPFFMLPARMENNKSLIENTYNSTIGNEWFVENIRPGIDKYLGGTFRLFSYYVFEGASYGKNEETKLHVLASLEKGATVHQMNEAYLQMENYLRQFKEIRQFSTNVYSGSYASMEITFKEPYDEGSFPYTLKSRLIRKALDLGGMDWNIYGVGNGYESGGGANEPVNFRVEARGYNYDKLNSLADSLKKQLKTHPRVRNVIVRENSARNRKRSFEYVLNLDKERLALLNTEPLLVYRDLKALTLSKFEDISLTINGKYTPVRFEEAQSGKFGVWQIQNEMLGPDKKRYNLKQTSTINKVLEDENIFKENQEYIRLLEFQYTGAEKFGVEFLNETLEDFVKDLPLGFSFEESFIYGRSGIKEDNNYIFLLILILLIIYTICAILFESIRQPFIILSIIPISYIGIFLTFYLFDFNFDQGGMASFILLSGITVNASIFIVNGFNSLLKIHPSKPTIILYLISFKRKIFPILLTILSTILGFIPFLLDGQKEVFWFALGIGTIGGLIFSFIAILIYLPMFSIKFRS